MMKYLARMSGSLKLKRLGAMLLALYGAVLVWNAARVGITIDEPTRLLGAQLYWMNLPDHHPKDQPPLLSMVTGWAPRLLGIPLMLDHPIWKRHWKDHVSSFILDRVPGETIGRLFFLARLGVIPFAILTALLLWHWAKFLLPETTAFLVLALFLLLPEARGHAALVTSDMAATFTYLLAGYCAWRYWRAPGRMRAVWLGVAAGLAVIAKFSLLIVPPLALLVVLARAVGSREGRRAAPAAVAAVVVLPWLVAVAAYKFDTRRMTPAELADMERRQEYPPALVAAARVLTLVPTPREMQDGIRAMGNYYHDGTRVFLLGHIYPHGHWAYYPVCLALKPPIGFQILLLLGLGVLVWGLAKRALPADRLFLLAPGLIYMGFAMHSPIQVGIRLILPAIAYFVLVAGFGIEWLRSRRWGKPALAGIFLFIVLSTGRIFPHDISYFNEWAGGPERGWRYLSDSNIDWGHLLPELAAYMKKNGIAKVKMFPFGFDKPHRYFPHGEVEIQYSPWTPDKIRGPVYVPEPGIYAVPVSLLGGQFYEPEFKDFLRYFRDREPDARLGWGLWIFYVSERPTP
jgi:hypothetical protein